MPRLGQLKIEQTGQGIPALIRELNRYFDSIRGVLNLNFLQGYPQVDAWVDQNADVPVWISPGDYEIDRWFLYPTTVATNPTVNLRLNGVNQETETPTVVQVYEYELASPVAVTRLDVVSLNVASLTAGGFIAAGIGLRRLN